MKRVFLKLISRKKLINTQTAKFEKQALKTDGFYERYKLYFSY